MLDQFDQSPESEPSQILFNKKKNKFKRFSDKPGMERISDFITLEFVYTRIQVLKLPAVYQSDVFSLIILTK